MDDDFGNAMASTSQSGDRLEDGRSEDDKVSRGI